jgi:uncharacterized protein (DUF924 family)
MDVRLDLRARRVLDFWFGRAGSARFGRFRNEWFQTDEARDAAIRKRFGPLIDAGMRGELDSWQATSLGALALVIVLDQFSRNCYRNSARAYAADPQALRVARCIVDTGIDAQLPTPYHRAFAYMPLVHDETRESQREALCLFTRAGFAQLDRQYFRVVIRHAEIIERFGRFPHRNARLGRTSTDAEIDFLHVHESFD